MVGRLGPVPVAIDAADEPAAAESAVSLRAVVLEAAVERVTASLLLSSDALRRRKIELNLAAVSSANAARTLSVDALD